MREVENVPTATYKGDFVAPAASVGRLCRLIGALALSLLAACSVTPSIVETARSADPVFEPAGLTENVSCSEGFRVRDESQTTGLIIDLPVDSETGASIDGRTTYSLVDEDVQGFVLFGEFIFYQLCDDVLEPNEPEQLIEVRWQIVEGTIELAAPIPPDPGGGGGIGLVSASAVGLVAENADGERVEVGDLELENRAWGFYGG